MPRDADGPKLALDPILELLQSVWALNHALERTSIRMESSLGLTAQQRFVIRTLGRAPGITPGELSELLHVDPGSVTAMIKRLEARELVVRKRDTEDGRRISLFLTARGRKLDVPAPISVEQAVADALARSSKAEITATRRMLAKLVTALDEVSAAAEDDLD